MSCLEGRGAGRSEAQCMHDRRGEARRSACMLVHSFILLHILYNLDYYACYNSLFLIKTPCESKHLIRKRKSVGALIVPGLSRHE
jgi:hypothetical protein